LLLRFSSHIRKIEGNDTTLNLKGQMEP